MRKPGSCRFDPYYKVQTWDPVAVAWRDIQKMHPDEKAAHAAAPVGVRYRLMCVTERGRTPGEARVKEEPAR